MHPTPITTEEVVKRLKSIRKEIDFFISALETTDFNTQLKEKLIGSDNEFLLPYFLAFKIKEPLKTIEKLAEGPGAKSRWIYSNLIQPRIDLSESNLLVCPLPNDSVNGVHNPMSFHKRCLDSLFSHIINKDPSFLKLVQEFIIEVIENKQLRKQYKIAAEEVSDFNIDNYEKLKRDLVALYINY